jgi:hypothetical protein
MMMTAIGSQPMDFGNAWTKKRTMPASVANGKRCILLIQGTMAYHRSVEPQRFSVSLVTQGRHRFYTLTLPSDVLANTCFVTSRDEDPKAGFQRVLDKKRAQQIADYIDVGLGTIPTSIILSAQKAADLKVIGRRLSKLASPYDRGLASR